MVFYTTFYTTDKIDNLTCEITYGNFTCDDYRLLSIVFNAILGGNFAGNGTIILYNKQKNTWMLGNVKFISRVDKDISLGRYSLVR